MGRLNGKVAIVTGASSGIGRAIAAAFAAEGASVVAAARSADRLAALVEEIVAAGGEAMACAADVSDEADVARLFGECVSRYGGLDILVNNAGVTSRLATEVLPLADWKRVIDVNVTGVFLCAREAFRIMKPRGVGRIINIGSVAAKAPRANAVAYTTSKNALEGLTRSLAVDGREFGVTVAIVQPGNTLSELWRHRGELAEREGIMEAADVAEATLMVAAMPPSVNVYETVLHPIRMPWIGRG
jgi:NAD(P)-dependent dehydrogenase (short-subunit alcohol dehydrogenase family)